MIHFEERKTDLLAADTSAIKTVRDGDNQSGSHRSVSVSTPAGRVGSACEALSAKDGVEAGSIPGSRLGTLAVNGREHVRDHTQHDPLADDWAGHVRDAYPGLAPSDIDALRCAYTNGGAFAMLGILTARRGTRHG